MGNLEYLVEKHFLDINLEKYLQLNLHITDKCNLKCKYCSSYDNSKNHKELNTFLKYIRYVSEDKEIVDIYYHGGEPLLHPNIFWFTKKLAELPNLRKLIFYTNLSKEPKALPEKCYYQPTFHPDYIKFEIFLKNLEKIKNYIYKIVIMPPWENYKEKILKEFPEISEDKIELSGIDDSESYLEMDLEYITNLGILNYSKVKTISYKNMVCWAKKCNLFIDNNGEIYSCTSHFLSKEKPLGNFRKKFEKFETLTICKFKTCCNGLELPKVKISKIYVMKKILNSKKPKEIKNEN